MIIQLKGVGEINKGAYLMFLSIIQYFEDFHSDKDITFVVHMGHKFSTELADRYNIKPLVKTKRKGIELRAFAKLVPFSFRKKMNLYIEDDLDVVLEASGFLYGDQWPVRSIRGTLSNDIERMRNFGTKVILMPQAFGPFKKNDVKKEVEKIVSNANLIFSRDKTSLKYLTDSFGKKSNVFLAPDFTNILRTGKELYTEDNSSRVLIIPNNKLLEQTNISKLALLNVFKEIIEEIKINNLTPAFLIHEGIKDEEFAREVNEILSKEIPIIIEPDALKQKQIIGSAFAVITGRFHGLVSALAQGVPSIALSWSHKYEMLLQNYGQENFLINLHETNIKPLVRDILDKENNEKIRITLIDKSKIEKDRTHTMWSKIEDLIF